MMGVVSVIGVVLVAAIAGAATINVNPGVGTPVQDAINAANPGDTVHLNAGDYREWVTINKGIILEGAGSGSTTMRGWGRYQNQAEYDAHKYDSQYSTIAVTSSGVEIRNMRIEEARNYGIEVYKSGTTFTGISIHDCKFDYTGQSSIQLYQAPGAQVYSNEAFRSTRQTWYKPAGTGAGSLVNSTRGGDVVNVWNDATGTAVYGNTSHSSNLPIFLMGASGVNVHDNNLDVRAPTTSSSYNMGYVDTTGIYIMNTSNATFDKNTVTGSGYLALNAFGTSASNTFTNNTFNSPVRDATGSWTAWASSNTWNDGHQTQATTPGGGQWYQKGTCVVLTQPVASGNVPQDPSLVLVEKTAPGAPWVGEQLEATSTRSPHTFTALIQFYYTATELTASGYTADELRIKWFDPGSGWQLPNAAYGGHTYSGTNRGELCADIATDLVLGDYGYYDDASYKYAWAYVDHFTKFGMVPEPATLALLALGGVAAVVRRRRAKK
jgi:parallel beta-helix repeat protein